MKISKKVWLELSSETISEESVRRIYANPEMYRFSPYKYEPGIRFPEAVGHPYEIYILEGCCKYEVDESEITIAAGEVASIPKGQHWFEVSGADTVKVMKVFRLPGRD